MRTVIVGGGVIGLWCARELAREGVEVVVLEGATESAASTPASAGWVVPVLSHPLSGPGVVRRSLSDLAWGRGAFSVGPSPSPELVRWLWAFTRSGTAPRFRQGLRATLDLAGSCMHEYAGLRESHPAMELHHDGLLMVARTEHGLAEAAALVRDATSAGYDGKTDDLDRDGLLGLEPALSGDVVGGVHARDEMHVRPEHLLAALGADVRERGARVLTGAKVRAVTPASGGRWTVVTSGGDVHADRVVIAAGFWSKGLLATLGTRVPLQPAAGFSVTASGPQPPVLPLKLVEANVAVTPFDGGVRLAGRFALGPPPRKVSTRQIDRVVSAASPYLRSWRPDQVSVRHVGLRPVTPDSLPLVGEVPGRRGVLAATGHGMLGLTLAPGTAAEIRHQVVNGSPSTIGEAFAVGRFGANPPER